MSITNNKIASNGEEFTRSDYNGVSIIIRDKDGFINATKIAKDNGKQKNLDKYFKSDKWKEIHEAFKNSLPKKVGGDKIELIYTIKTGTQEIYGSYVHPELIHFVAEWCDISYAFKVSAIMNNINRIKDLKSRDGNDNLDSIIRQQKSEIDKLTGTVKEKDDKIDQLLNEIREVREQNDKLLKENKKQTKKLNHLIDVNDDMKDQLCNVKGRLSGEEVKDSKILMMYPITDEYDDTYIKIVRAQPDNLRGDARRKYQNQKSCLFVSFLPEAINQHKSVIKKVLAKRIYRKYIDMNETGNITKLYIYKKNYIEHKQKNKDVTIDDDCRMLYVNEFINQFVEDYKRELREQLRIDIEKVETNEEVDD